MMANTKQGRKKKVMKEKKSFSQGVKQLFKNPLFLMSLFLVTVTFLSYLPVFENNFVDYDDKKFIYGNTSIRGLDKEHVAAIFEKSFLSPWYKPIVYLSWAVEYYFFGLNPVVYHTNNLILHILNSLLVFLIMIRILNRISPSYKFINWVALLIAALFSLSPVKVESVAWAVERKDVLFSFFFLSSMLLYLRYLDNKKYRNIVIGSLLFGLSLLSKSMAITLPAILFLIDYLYKKKLNITLFLEKAPYLVVLIAGFYFYGFFSKHTGDVGITHPGNVNTEYQINKDYYPDNASYLTNKAIFASYRINKWVTRSVAPAKLSVVHPLPKLYFDKNVRVINLLHLILIIAALTAAVLLFNRSRVFGFTIAFFLIMIVPVLGMEIYESHLSDRYLYIPSLAIYFLIGMIVIWVLNKKPKSKYFLGILMVVYLTYFSAATFERIKVWKNSISLFTDLTKKYPNLYFGYSSLGNSYLELGNPNQAIINYDNALKLKPYQPFVFNARGLAKHNIGDYQGALRDYDRSIAMEPRFSKAYNNRGNSKLVLGQYPEAIKDYNIALNMDPGYAMAHNGRGMVWQRMGEYEKSIIDFSHCIANDPYYVIAYSNRGQSKAMLKDFDGAIPDYNVAIRLNPNFVMAYNGRGYAKLNKKDYAGALKDFNIAISKNSRFALAYFNRGVAKHNLNDFSGACADWKNSYSLGFKDAKNNIENYCK